MRIARLREETASDHDAVETALPLMRADLTLDGYRQAMERVYGVVAPWESLLQDSSDPIVQRLAPARARAQLLRRDLEHLQSDPDLLPVAPMPSLPDRYHVLGAMYVMEGSRLGGQLLARHLAGQFPSLESRATSYFQGFGTQTGTMWKEFVALLESEIPEDNAEAVIAGAHAMFARFGSWVAPSAAPVPSQHPSPQTPSGGL